MADSRKLAPITLDMILSSSSLDRIRSETQDQYLERITHLHLQAKRVKKIGGLEKCPNVKALYLYDNFIETMEGLEYMKHLSYLYLQNNIIKSISSLQNVNLKKLFLDENELAVVSGLENCPLLEELHVARQRRPGGLPLEFDPESFLVICNSLLVLEISGNGISNLTQFGDLHNLKKFICNDNDVHDITEIESIVRLPKIEEATLLKNPCCATRRYRDFVVGWSSDSLKILDNQPIPKHYQVAMKGLMGHRRKIGAEMPRSMRQADQDLDFAVLSTDDNDPDGLLS